MEKYVELLYNRLSDADKMKLFVMTESANNETHNNGIMSQLSPEVMKRVHDPDPNVRVAEKTSLAKSVGRTFVQTSQPVPLETGIGHLISIVYDERFVNCISVCIQGGIEGLYQSNVWQHNQSKIMEYHILVENNGGNIKPFMDNMTFLNEVYPNFKIIIKNMNEEPSKQGFEIEKTEKKKGFFSKLFGK